MQLITINHLTALNIIIKKLYSTYRKTNIFTLFEYYS